MHTVNFICNDVELSIDAPIKILGPNQTAHIGIVVVPKCEICAFDIVKIIFGKLIYTLDSQIEFF